jgi:hypothetical protein
MLGIDCHGSQGDGSSPRERVPCYCAINHAMDQDLAVTIDTSVTSPITYCNRL